MFSVGAGYATAHTEVIQEVTNMCILAYVGHICGEEGVGGVASVDSAVAL